MLLLSPLSSTLSNSTRPFASFTPFELPDLRFQRRLIAVVLRVPLSGNLLPSSAPTANLIILPSSLGFIKSSRSKRRRMRLAYTHLILKMPVILMSATCKRPVLFGTPSAVAAAGGSFKFV